MIRKIAAQLSMALCFYVACTTTGVVQAADETVIQLIENPQVSGNVIRLGDLIQIRDAQGTAIEKLLKMPMGPAPQGSDVQTWTQDEVFRHLELRGIHSASVRWTGARVTRISASTPKLARANEMMPAFIENRMVLQAKNILTQAISDYVQYQSGESIDWQIDGLKFPIQATKALQSRRSIVGIGGGKPPWDGVQKFTVEVTEKGTTSQISVEANLELPPMVVVAKRPIRREEVISPEALTYRSISQRESKSQKFFLDINEVVGKQAKRSISTGLPILDENVGEPILIRRHTLVQLESVAGAIVVKTQAKAIGSGAAGELIEVQTLDTRQKLYATIVDSMTVRIAARPSRTVR